MIGTGLLQSSQPYSIVINTEAALYLDSSLVLCQKLKRDTIPSIIPIETISITPIVTVTERKAEKGEFPSWQL